MWVGVQWECRCSGWVGQDWRLERDDVRGHREFESSVLRGVTETSLRRIGEHPWVERAGRL